MRARQIPAVSHSMTRAVVQSLRLTVALLLLTLAAALPMRVGADTTTYSSSKRTYKVGILLIDSTTDAGNPARGPENPDPYVFYIADAREDVKPQGWEILNPLAPGVVTPQIRDRWLARDPANPYQLGQKVTKNMAGYWEVSLTDTSIQDLLKFDLLYVHNHRPTAFTPADREKLRKLVDAGGVVFIEDCGNMNISANAPFFLEDVQFRQVGGNNTPVVYAPDHPLVNTPYKLSFQEISQLGDKRFTNSIQSHDPTNPGNILSQAPNPETLVNIIATSGAPDGRAPGRFLPYIAAGSYGSGAVVVSAADTGCEVNDFAGGTNAGSGGNSGAYCGPNIITAHTEDLKLDYNIIAWGSGNNAYRRNNRRTAAAFDGVGAPLVTNFDFINQFTAAQRPTDIVNSATAPLIVKSVLYVTGRQGANAVLRAYDLNPFADLDGDGNPDDGIPDLLIGLPYDEIYRVQMGGGGGNVQPSAPIYGRVQYSTTNPQPPDADGDDRIFVALADGTLVIFPAASSKNAKLANGTFNPAPAQLASVPGNGSGPYTQPANGPQAPAPVFFENKIYQVMPNGEVRCIDALSGQPIWRSFGQNNPNYQMEPTGTPTLGFVRQASAAAFAQNSNESTNDLMLYVPVKATDQNNNVSARVMAYWLGTRNEVQRSWAPGVAGQNGIMNTRVAGGPGGPAAGQYFVATGVLTRGSNPPGPFVIPAVRVFSTTVVNGNPVSAKENYQAGITSPDYTAVKDATGGMIDATGQVQIALVPGSSAPAPRPGQDILISVDYDVVYNDVVNNQLPPNYGSNPTQVGARPNASLTLTQYIDSSVAAGLRGLTTPAISPDDSVLFSLVQQFNNGNAVSPPLPSIYAINEQEGDASGSTSKTRWRFTLFNGFTATNAPTDIYITRQVDNTAVTDTVPILNYLRFDPNWPRTDSATYFGPPDATGNNTKVLEALREVTPVGSPITTNDGVTYVLARATSVANNSVMTVLMAFKTNPTISLILPEPFEETAGVTISQANLLSDQSATTSDAVTVSANQTINPNVTLDGAQGRINLLNSRAGGKTFSASQSFVVRYTPRGTRQERRVVIPPVPLAVSDPNDLPIDATGHVTLNPGGFTPLQWYYVVPGDPGLNTSPTLAGDYIYWVANVNGAWHTIGVDADAAAKDSTVRPGFGQQVQNVTALFGGPSTKINHVRMAQPIGPLGLALNADIAPPVISQGQLVVNTSLGSFAYQPGITLIADAKRVIEAAADGAAVWSLDAATDRRVGGGDEPVYGPTGQILNPPATGTPRVIRTSLAKPQMTRKIATSDYLIADTGNNRAIRTDRAGRLIWSFSRISDPYGLLASGEPTTLSEPTDVQFYTAPTLDNGGNVAGYEIHYLVADAGNYRIIEVADYYNQQGQRVPPPPPYAPGANPSADDHALVWVSRTAGEQGRRLRFQSIQRFLDVAPPNGPFNGAFGYPYITAIVSNNAVGSSGSSNSADFTGGSLVQLSYAPYNTAVPLRNAAGAIVGTPKLWQWGGGPNARASEPSGNGNVQFAAEQLRIITGGNAQVKRLNAPNFFQQLNLPATAATPARTLYLICDADGAYVVEARVNGNTITRDVLWMFTQQDYNAMNGLVGNTLVPGARIFVPGVSSPNNGTAVTLNAGQLATVAQNFPKFSPTSIQLLPSGNYLITNTASGRNALFNSGEFVGEVFEVDPAGFSVLIPGAYGDTRRGGTFAFFSVPRIITGSTQTGQTGLNYQLMGNPTSNTALVEQPLSASRP